MLSISFYLTPDRHIAITDGNACMSVPGYNEGDAHMTGEVFLGPCITGNAYQGESMSTCECMARDLRS